MTSEMENEKHTIVSQHISSESASRVQNFFRYFGGSAIVPPNCDTKDFYSHLIRGILKVQTVQRGRISCVVTNKPAVTNVYGGMHGGAVASVGEIVSIACARTVVGKDKELFLGELSTCYLSAAPANAEMVVDASVVRSGRNLTIASVEYRLKESKRLVYTYRATFYHMPASSL